MEKMKFMAFLRGINVGGHHKVPMSELKSTLENLNLKNVITLLNSGNIVFESDQTVSEDRISGLLEKTFGFPVPTILRTADSIAGILTENPFRHVDVSKNIRLYVSFLRKNVDPEIQLPWESPDGSYKILELRDKTVFSVLDVSKSGTPKAMEVLERQFSKDITTRNWNTLVRLGQKAGL